MASYTTSTVIAAPVEKVFSLLSEPADILRWAEGVESIDFVSGGPTQPGARFKQRVREGGRVVEYDGEVAAADPPRHIAVEVGNRQFSMRIDHRLRPDGAATHVEQTVRMTPHSLSARLLGFLFSWFTRGISRKQLAKLKRVAEGAA
jgi:uncharacterized protein YndB with AHSA1/START domain